MSERPDSAPRRPVHPRLVALPLAAVAAALVLAVIGLTPADGDVVEVAWLVALALAVATAIPTIATGLADLRHLEPRSRGRRRAAVHGGLMVGASWLLVALLVLGLIERGGGIGTFEALATIVVVAFVTGAATLGVVAAQVFGAGVREETLRPEDRGARAPAGAGRDR